MRQSSEFYLNVAKKQQSLLEQFKRTSSWASIWIENKHSNKIEVSLPTLETKPNDENPYQNLFIGKQFWISFYI